MHEIVIQIVLSGDGRDGNTRLSASGHDGCFEFWTVGPPLMADWGEWDQGHGVHEERSWTPSS
ncbi:hypothetical protein [Chitinilyticum litopenaei]|uniref:hypothetical protein n=1 Tax=Chitinilyticum litopenaei TaxID=1121276 RepID=UPI001FE1F0B0|nr:hypothetical protein [Chitinilyticum litopenaei]